MKIHFIKTSELAKELASNKVSEKTAFHYFLANTLLWTLVLYYGSFLGANANLLFIVEIIVVLLITLLGLLKAFEANYSDDGTNFVVRATCLSLPIGIKVNIASIVLSWAFYFSFPIIIDPATFREPERVYDLVAFVWAPIFTALFFWRLWVHFNVIAKLSAPNNTLNRT